MEHDRRIERRHPGHGEQVACGGTVDAAVSRAMAQDGVFESDEELEQFLAHVYAARHADLA